MNVINDLTLALIILCKGRQKIPRPLNISNIYIYIKVCSLGFIKLAPIKKVSKESKNSEERQRERERERESKRGKKI